MSKFNGPTYSAAHVEWLKAQIESAQDTIERLQQELRVQIAVCQRRERELEASERRYKSWIRGAGPTIPRQLPEAPRVPRPESEVGTFIHTTGMVADEYQGTDET